jgi:hypothetical protein
MGDHEQQVAKKYARMDFDELADAPLEALGLSNNDVDALKQALGIRTVASWPNTDSSAAQAIVNLTGPRQQPTARPSRS